MSHSVAWRRTVRPTSNLVVEGGFLYLVEGGLRAIRLEDGQDACRPQSMVPREGRCEIAVCRGWILAWTREEVSGIPHQGSGFGMGWRKKNPFSGPPLVYRGRFFASDGRDLAIVRPETGVFRKVATGFHADEPHRFIGKKIVKTPHRI